MIDFERFELPNGLKVIVHQDNSTPLACINILYNVGRHAHRGEKRTSPEAGACACLGTPAMAGASYWRTDDQRERSLAEEGVKCW